MGAPVVSERALAETYDPESGWETVQQYREATRLATEHPDLSRAEIARRVDRSPNTVYGWLAQDKTPAPVKAIKAAQDHGWLSAAPSTEVFRALNQLVAWIFSGGGIRRDRFVPTFSADDQLALATLVHLLTEAGVSSRIREPASGEHALEVIPDTAASVLGRVLSVLGAPVGSKSDAEALSLPAYLDTVSTAHRRDFARIYLFNRGAGLDSTAGNGVYLAEARPASYRQSLGDFLSSLSRGPVSNGCGSRRRRSAISPRGHRFGQGL